MIDAKYLESSGSFNTEQPSYINTIFEGTSDYGFHIWFIHKHNEVM